MTGDRNDKDDINKFLVSRPWLSSLRRREPAEILETLERATGIPYDDLRRKFCPSPSEVDKRMMWAAGRKTTRVEDVAYSLGLRVPLVISPDLSTSVRICAGHGYSITLDCPLCPSIKIDIDTSYRLDSVNQYAFGIVNYSLIGGVPGIRDRILVALALLPMQLLLD
ncbi:hypothetical protein BDR03DRAFT_997182 [Suillus americanus]|nr:hypothetical protein BDR03DRAFT_997182 [Suillus americanus]